MLSLIEAILLLKVSYYKEKSIIDATNKYSSQV